LLLTNDGLVQHKLCDPRFAHERTYWAQVEGEPSDEAIAQLCAGVQIKGYTTRPARVRRLESEPELPPRTPPIRYRANIPTTWLELTLTEGKNRQVRRMTAAVGHPTLRLVRAAFCLAPQHLPDGSCCVTLDGLSPGAWRELSLPASLWP
jgi:23S rRNA pseudouridine2457 synthase